MHQFTPYMLTTLLSATIILVLGICQLMVSVPQELELRNYRISRRFLAGAYIILAVVGQWEVLGGTESDNRLPVMAFTLIATSFQALLFTFSIITLINIRYITARKVWGNILPLSLLSGILLAVLFQATAYFYPVFYAMLVLYCLQLIYYIVLFIREYNSYRCRIDDFFSGDEFRRLIWIRNSFYMAAFVGIIAIASIFASTGAYIIFTIAYTVFYIYFAVKYTNYVNQFHRFAPVLAKPAGNETNGNGNGNNGLSSSLDRWISDNGFISPDINLDMLAKHLNTNQTYLSRHINTKMGLNFKSWISSLRIAESQRLLSEQPDMSVTKIGEMVGIENRSSFFRQFQQVTGMSPGEYRKKLESKSQKNDGSLTT